MCQQNPATGYIKAIPRALGQLGHKRDLLILYLITGADILVATALVDARGDIGTLLLQTDQDVAGLVVET